MRNQSSGSGTALSFGQGLISGYASVFLGILSLCGVLCFKYPAILTSEQFRAAYTQDFVRTILFWSLIAAYFSGIISYALNRSKFLAWLGIGTAFAASLLGGSRIEVAAYESSAYSLGLDWFAISLLFSMLIFIPIEKAFALRREQVILRHDWRIDLTYFFVGHLLIQFIFLWTNTFADTAFSWAATESLQSAVRSMPIWLQFIAATFLADFFQYWTHRLHHITPFLWKFHAVHHSSRTMDWLAGSRTHIVGTNFGVLRYLIATPQFHHWHHSRDREYCDANYAVHLPLIDMLFGTFKCPRGQWPAEYGVVSGEPPPTFWQQFLHPFRRSKQSE